MNYKELKKELQEIVKIAQAVPEEFRDKCFEVLLGRWIDSSESCRARGQQDDLTNENNDAPGGRIPIPTHAALSAFLHKHKITEGDLTQILHIDDEGKVTFDEMPPAGTTNASKVINWALLSALSNAITEKFFNVHPEGLRSICQDKGCYESARSGDFWSTLNNQKNKTLFSGALKSRGKSQRLAPPGQAKLAELIRAMVGGDS